MSIASRLDSKSVHSEIATYWLLRNIKDQNCQPKQQVDISYFQIMTDRTAKLRQDNNEISKIVMILSMIFKD